MPRPQTRSADTPLARYRLAAGLTQQQLADLSGLHIRRIQAIEYGEVSTERITAKVLLALADALQVDPHNLI